MKNRWLICSNAITVEIKRGLARKSTRNREFILDGVELTQNCAFSGGTRASTRICHTKAAVISLGASLRNFKHVKIYIKGYVPRRSWWYSENSPILHSSSLIHQSKSSLEVLLDTIMNRYNEGGVFSVLNEHGMSLLLYRNNNFLRQLPRPSYVKVERFYLSV